jgi:Holliday junction resolvase RusA-like endonuclease
MPKARSQRRSGNRARKWPDKPLKGGVGMHVTLYFGTKRKADWVNFHKLSCDALNGIAYDDDSQIWQVTVALAYDKENPHRSRSRRCEKPPAP